MQSTAAAPIGAAIPVGGRCGAVAAWPPSDSTSARRRGTHLVRVARKQRGHPEGQLARRQLSQLPRVGNLVGHRRLLELDRQRDNVAEQVGHLASQRPRLHRAAAAAGGALGWARAGAGRSPRAPLSCAGHPRLGCVVVPGLAAKSIRPIPSAMGCSSRAAATLHCPAPPPPLAAYLWAVCLCILCIGQVFHVTHQHRLLLNDLPAGRAAPGGRQGSVR